MLLPCILIWCSLSNIELSSPDTRLRNLLASSNYNVDEEVIAKIYASGWLSSRLAVVCNEKQATSLYIDN